MYALTSPDNLLDNIQVLDKGGTSDDIDVERKTPQILSAFTISPKVANDKRAKAYLSPKSGLPNNVKKMIKKPLKNNSVDMDSPRYIKSNLPSLEGTLHGRNQINITQLSENKHMQYILDKEAHELNRWETLLEEKRRLHVYQKEKDAFITQKLNDKSQLALDRLQQKQEDVRQKNLESFNRMQAQEARNQE